MIHSVQANLGINAYQSNYDKLSKDDAKKQSSETTKQQSENVVYQKSEPLKKRATYDKEVQRQVYLNRALEMQAETERRTLELFGDFAKNGIEKQAKEAGGLKALLQRAIDGENVEGLEITQEKIDAAKEAVGPDGFYSAEATSDRFIEFAKVVSQDNPDMADKLMNAFKQGYAQAEEIWGGELPEISQKTYDMTLEKFDAWKNGTEVAETVA